MMIRTLQAGLCVALALAWCAPAAAQGGREQYISDEITLTVRQAPRNDAPGLGVVKSGSKVTVLEVLGADSFARIRTADGREGWITARFLSSQPAARERADAVRAELDLARSRVESLEKDLAQARDQLSRARPALELAQDKERLQAQIAQLEGAAAEARSAFDVERARRKTLATGAALVGAGIVLGFLLPWLGQSRRRRGGDW